MPQVRDVMTTDLTTIEPGAGIVGAAQRMIAEEKGQLPVVEGGRVLGTLTDRDIVSRLVAEGHDPQAVNVEDVHTDEPVTIGPDQDVEEARRLMTQHQVDRLLVLDDERRLVGIITKADLP